MNKRLILNLYDDGSISVKPVTTWLELVSFVNTMNKILKQCQQARMDSLCEQRQEALDEYRKQYEAVNQDQRTSGQDEIDGMDILQAAIMSIAQ